MRILCFGDLHCGHLLGLTPPLYQRQDWALSGMIEEFWEWFDKSLPKTVDYAIWNGDLVEGEGKKDTCHHLTTNMVTQQEMAKAIGKSRTYVDNRIKELKEEGVLT